MKKYFYSNGKEKQGPFSFHELKNEDIKKETLIWFEGLEDWKPAEEIKEFKEILELKPPPIVEDYFDTYLEDNKTNTDTIEELDTDIDNISDDNNEIKVKEVSKKYLDATTHPWRRLFARTVDVFVVTILIFYVLGYVFVKISPDIYVSLFALAKNPIWSGFLAYFFWFPLEALFISSIGTTPAKWVFGISVLSKSLEKLSYANAFKRVFLVFLQGEGLGIPVVIIITRLFAHKRLKRTSTTLWDTSVDSIVLHKKWGIFRTIICVIYILIILIIVSILLQP